MPWGGVNLFYATIQNSKGRSVFNGYFMPNGTELNINARTVLSRAIPPTIPSLGTKITLPVERVSEGALADLVTYRDTYENYYDMCTKLKVDETPKWDINSNGDDDDLMWKNGERINVPNLYRLSGVDFSNHDNGFTGKYLRTFFGNYVNTDGVAVEGVFKESIDHVALMHHSNEKYNVKPDVIYTVTDGDIIDNFGQIELDCIWRGTDADYDFFGYYYYDPNDYTDGKPSAEEIWNMNKYILIDEKGGRTSGVWIGGTPKTSLTQGMTAQWRYNPATSANDILHYEGQSWTDLTGGECATYMNNQEMNLIRGTKIQLTYFGKDGKATPSFDFPVGTKVAFFIGWNQGTTASSNRILFSDCSATYLLFRRGYVPNESFKSSMEADMLPATFKATHTENDHIRGYEGELVRPFAATFKLGDVVIMGFGDEVAGDKDLNDICFFVNGDIDDSDIPEMQREDIPVPETQSWILTCEDLGNTDDFDFNDVVVKVSHAAGETKAKVEALAAGGTLPIELRYKGEALTGPNGKTAFHSWFGDGAILDDAMINTGGKSVSAQGKSIEIGVDPAFTMSSTVSDYKMGGFGLYVDRTGTTNEDAKNGGANTATAEISAPEAGNAPQMMCLPGNWVWPTERTTINDAYPEFGEWGANYNVNKWYLKYNRAALVKTPDYASQDVPQGGVDPDIPGEGGGSIIDTYTIPVTSFDNYTQDWTGYGYQMDLSSVDYTDVTKIEYELVADQNTEVTFYNNTNWGTINQLFTTPPETNKKLLMNSVEYGMLTNVYIQTNNRVQLTNAQLKVIVTRPKIK